ncbi:MAG: hypothetical protein HC811_02070 [Flammeovirgaceae bacterium]|nr:hypothetical protein [Flammeovirgaceae bacterium]
MAGFSNLTNREYNYYDSKDNANPLLVQSATFYNYIGNLFRLDNLSISFGYVYPLYDPRKLKRARKKGVKEISKEVEE